MEKTKDWAAVTVPKILLIGENSTLQWSDEVIKHVMFLDYFFGVKPYDLGERSRFTEAKLVLEHIDKLTGSWCSPQCVFATNISLDLHTRPPKGKHILVPEDAAKEGVERIRTILKENPTIKYIFAMDLQVNYYLQKFGLYDSENNFVHNAQPRTVGLTSNSPYYQPVNAKAYVDICGKFYKVNDSDIEIVPILPAKDYPLSENNMKKYGDNYIAVQKFFKKNFPKQQTLVDSDI